MSYELGCWGAGAGVRVSRERASGEPGRWGAGRGERVSGKPGLLLRGRVSRKRGPVGGKRAPVPRGPESPEGGRSQSGLRGEQLAVEPGPPRGAGQAPAVGLASACGPLPPGY